MTDGQAKEKCVDVFKMELKAAESLDALVDGNDKSEIESAVRETVNDLYPNMDTPKRQGRVLLFAHEIAQEVGCEGLADETEERYMEFIEKAQQNG